MDQNDPRDFKPCEQTPGAPGVQQSEVLQIEKNIKEIQKPICQKNASSSS